MALPCTSCLCDASAWTKGVRQSVRAAGADRHPPGRLPRPSAAAISRKLGATLQRLRAGDLGRVAGLSRPCPCRPQSMTGSELSTTSLRRMAPTVTPPLGPMARPARACLLTRSSPV